MYIYQLCVERKEAGQRILWIKNYFEFSSGIIFSYYIPVMFKNKNKDNITVHFLERNVMNVLVG